MAGKGHKPEDDRERSHRADPSSRAEAARELDREFRDFRTRLDELLNFPPVFPFDSRRTDASDDDGES
jgi:hypothetical protein